MSSIIACYSPPFKDVPFGGYANPLVILVADTSFQNKAF